MKSVFFPLIAVSLTLGGCAPLHKSTEPPPESKPMVLNQEDILGEFVCGTNILIRHKNGLYFESGTELVKPDYKAIVVSNREGGYTTAYDYDERSNTLAVTKSSRWYGVRPTITLKCE